MESGVIVDIFKRKFIFVVEIFVEIFVLELCWWNLWLTFCWEFFQIFLPVAWLGILRDEERTRTEELGILEVGFSNCVVSVGRSERWFWHLPAFSGNCDTHFPTFAFLSISRRQFCHVHFHFFPLLLSHFSQDCHRQFSKFQKKNNLGGLRLQLMPTFSKLRIIRSAEAMAKGHDGNLKQKRN